MDLAVTSDDEKMAYLKLAIPFKSIRYERTGLRNGASILAAVKI